MALTADQAVARALDLYSQQEAERQDLDVLRLYVTGKQRMPLVIPQDAPREVKEMARISRINIIAIVVNALVESLFVDSIRTVDDAAPGDDPADPAADPASDVWQVLQSNRFDTRQSGLYRAVFTYGYGYMVAVPGQSDTPVVRAASPRRMTALYGYDPDWPIEALEHRRGGRFTLYDDEAIYELGRSPKGDSWQLLAEPIEHGLDYCPVVRYVDAEDLDLDDEPAWSAPPYAGGAVTNVVAGQVAPLLTLQDQADVTTFGLRSAEWYTAFRQRWIVGWTPESRSAKVSAAASQMWTFDDHPDDIRLGEFAETTLDGYLRSRDATARFAATLSQTPVHELIGELVNLSAEALAAAEAGRDRKVDLRKNGFGESHEQLSGLIGDLRGVDVPDDIEIVWRDTSARAFGAIVDGLGKLAQMLDVPPEALWERIPGATRQEVQRWGKLRREGDALSGLTSLLDRQASGAPDGTGERTTSSGIILPPGAQA